MEGLIINVKQENNSNPYINMSTNEDVQNFTTIAEQQVNNAFQQYSLRYEIWLLEDTDGGANQSIYNNRLSRLRPTLLSYQNEYKRLMAVEQEIANKYDKNSNIYQEMSNIATEVGRRVSEINNEGYNKYVKTVNSNRGIYTQLRNIEGHTIEMFPRIVDQPRGIDMSQSQYTPLNQPIQSTYLPINPITQRSKSILKPSSYVLPPLNEPGLIGDQFGPIQTQYSNTLTTGRMNNHQMNFPNPYSNASQRNTSGTTDRIKSALVNVMSAGSNIFTNIRERSRSTGRNFSSLLSGAGETGEKAIVIEEINPSFNNQPVTNEIQQAIERINDENDMIVDEGQRVVLRPGGTKDINSTISKNVDLSFKERSGNMIRSVISKGKTGISSAASNLLARTTDTIRGTRGRLSRATSLMIDRTQRLKSAFSRGLNKDSGKMLNAIQNQTNPEEVIIENPPPMEQVLIDQTQPTNVRIPSRSPRNKSPTSTSITRATAVGRQMLRYQSRVTNFYDPEGRKSVRRSRSRDKEKTIKPNDSVRNVISNVQVNAEAVQAQNEQIREVPILQDQPSVSTTTTTTTTKVTVPISNDKRERLRNILATNPHSSKIPKEEYDTINALVSDVRGLSQILNDKSSYEKFVNDGFNTINEMSPSSLVSLVYHISLNTNNTSDMFLDQILWQILNYFLFQNTRTVPYKDNYKALCDAYIGGCKWIDQSVLSILNLKVDIFDTLFEYLEKSSIEDKKIHDVFSASNPNKRMLMLASSIVSKLTQLTTLEETEYNLVDRIYLRLQTVVLSHLLSVTIRTTAKQSIFIVSMINKVASLGVNKEKIVDILKNLNQYPDINDDKGTFQKIWDMTTIIISRVFPSHETKKDYDYFDFNRLIFKIRDQRAVPLVVYKIEQTAKTYFENIEIKERVGLARKSAATSRRPGMSAPRRTGMQKYNK